MSPSLGDTSRGLKANINFYVFRIVSGDLGHKKTPYDTKSYGV